MAAVSFGLLKFLQATIGLRLSEQEELEGADASQHGERGYPDLDRAPHLRPREDDRARAAPSLAAPVRETS